MKTVFSALVGMMLLSSVAQAAEEKKADAKPAKMEAPKPAPEMEAMIKSMSGNWKCTGKMNMPADQGGTVETKGTMSFKGELGGFAMVGEHKGEKSKTMPAVQGMINIGYDAQKKEFEELYQDNMGGMGHASSKGMEGDKLVWDGEGQMMGKAMKTKMTITKKSDKEHSITHEADMGDGKWVTMMEETCKK